jgi:hypothetical protein
MSLLQILEKVLVALPGIVNGIETMFKGWAGPDKKTEALKGVGEILVGIAATGASVPVTTITTVAGDLIDAYVAAANAIGAFTHGTHEA